MYRTDKTLQPIAAIAAIAITAGMLAVAGHMKTELGPLDDIRTPMAVRSDRAPLQVAISPARIEVVGVRDASVAANPVRKSAG